MPTHADHRWASLAILAAGLAMIVLDGTIIGVALPTIINDLALELSAAQWINALYAVVFAALLMSFGRLGDLAGRRKIFITGVALFVVGSVLAAAATTGDLLITSRAIQGVGGAMVLPSSLSTVNATFRGPERATAFGIWGAVMAGAAAIGPLLGGWLTTALDWRWIFWVNVPLGVLVIGGALVFTPATADDKLTKKPQTTRKSRFDWVGLGLSAIGFGGFVFAIIEGPTLGWWAPQHQFGVLGVSWPLEAPVSVIPVVLTMSLTSIASFVAWQRHRLQAGRTAILNLGLFAVPTFTWGNATAMAVAMGEFALVFVLPLYLVGVLGLTALEAGWVLATMALGAFVAGSLARFAAARMGPARIVVLGLALELIGVATTALLMQWAGAAVWIAMTLGVYGVGLGLASAQLTSTVLADIPPAYSGQGSATQSTVRQVGSALGTAAAGSTLAIGMPLTITRALDGLDNSQTQELIRETRASAGGNLDVLRTRAADGDLGPDGEAIVSALTHGFASASALAVWFAVGFLVLGLLGALQVMAAHAARHERQQASPLES